MANKTHLFSTALCKVVCPSSYHREGDDIERDPTVFYGISQGYPDTACAQCVAHVEKYFAYRGSTQELVVMGSGYPLKYPYLGCIDVAKLLWEKVQHWDKLCHETIDLEESRKIEREFELYLAMEKFYTGKSEEEIIKGMYQNQAPVVSKGLDSFVMGVLKKAQYLSDNIVCDYLERGGAHKGKAPSPECTLHFQPPRSGNMLCIARASDVVAYTLSPTYFLTYAGEYTKCVKCVQAFDHTYDIDPKDPTAGLTWNKYLTDEDREMSLLVADWRESAAYRETVLATIREKSRRGDYYEKEFEVKCI